ncbi:hypothetical protein WJX72_007941 [[Myrmecia] bisecta]|uniref:Uncharacterized protein n=1 Tax=[Myrmecia] bisecta TaxID=41462 RepID=A0AAW1PNT9_9CHLO
MAAGNGAPAKAVMEVFSAATLQADSTGTKTSDKPVDPVSPPAVPFPLLFSTADRRDKLLMLFGTVGAIANGAALPAFSIIFGKILNTLGEGTGKADLVREVNKVTLYFVWLAIGTLICSYLEVAFWMQTGTRQTNRIRQRYLQAVLRQDVPFFDVKASTGQLLQGLNEDTLAIQNAIGEKVGNCQHHLATFIFGMAIAFWKGWSMTLVILAVTPLLAGAGAILAIYMGKMSTKAGDAYGRANSIASEALASIRTVVAFNSEQNTLQTYMQSLLLPQKMGITSSILQGTVLGVTNFIFLSSYALALWYGSTRVRANDYTGGDVMNVLFAALIGGFALGQAAPNLQYFQTGRVAGARVFEMLKRKPEIDEEDPGLIPEQVEGHVELRNVGFSYPARPDVQVFSNFSLSVPAGKTVALVGQSGSGKSTVVQLCERFYDPQQGQVLLDGHDLRQLELKWLREQVGLVSQEPTLFATTIFHNIAFGKAGATTLEVEAAAAAANAHNFISSLPKGYQTPVGEKGVQMSGGQKQRIAIARAILKNPKVLLLDEATSALDSQSERIVQAALDHLMKGRTTIVVAHRLSTIMSADSIAVVQGGKIVEQGTHTDLIANPVGAYAGLVKLQQQAYQKHKEHDEESDGEHSQRDPDEVDTLPVNDSQKSMTTSRHIHKSFAAEKGKPSQNFVERADEVMAKAGFWRLLQYNRPELHWAVVGACASAVNGLIMPAFSLCLSGILAVFYTTDYAYMKREVAKWCLVFLGTGTGALLACIFQQYSFGVMGQRLTRRLRGILMAAILHQELGWFDREENSSGAISGRLATDTVSIRGAVGDQVGISIQSIVTFVAAYVIAFTAGWKMTLVVTSTVPLLLLAAWIQGRFMMGFESKAGELFDQANQTASEAFSSIRTVAAFSLRTQIGRLYSKLLEGPTAASVKRSHASGLGFGASQFIMMAVYALAFWYGGLLISRDEISFKNMLKVFFAILMSAFGISQAQMAFPDLTKASAAVVRVFSVIDRKPKIDSNAPGKELGKVVGHVELVNITFAYPQRPDIMVFKGFSLAVAAGRTLALVGQSGSGKSTVIGLIERFYDPLKGQVLLDGQDIRTLQLHWLRSQIALVSQEPALFSCSILQNICYGRPDATLEEARAAARAANAHDFISSAPEGYDTQVGEGGIQLSGGQKQRVAIARAILKNPRILCLDEATSALDAESERLVQEALEHVSEGRTTIIIAHRLSTVRNANVIAVVQQGKILEQGTHEELLRNPTGGYAALVRGQQQAKQA